MGSNNQQFLSYKGCNFFRQRLILSCLSRKPIKITNIRDNEEKPGMSNGELNFLRLIDRISNGTKTTVNDTGSEVKFKPGILNGGRIEHTCDNSRSIGYYLEPLLILAPFMKSPLDITLRGVTNNNIDPSADQIYYAMLPILKKFFVVDEGLLLKVEKRGLYPKGGGIVHFRCPLRKTLKAFQWEEMGKVKKIRGVVFTSRVAPIVGNRILEAAKGVLKNYLQDVYFTCDNSKGLSPGYGMCLVAETNKGTHLTSELTKSKEDEATSEMNSPEDFGKNAAYSLLEEIHNGGCVDSFSQTLILSFMVLAPKDVSKVVLGPLTTYTINYLKHIKDFFGVSFKIDAYREKTLSVDEDVDDLKLGTQKLLFTCMGVGYTNVAKPNL